MQRRTYLGSLAGAGLVGAAGCLDFFSDDGMEPAEGAVLGPPSQTRGDPTHPTYGDDFPSFTIPDPLAETDVASADIVGDRAFLMTFIFTSCTDECGTLVQHLRQVQRDAAEEGYADDIALLAMTFDPETDDEDTLREYGDQYDVDLDAGNWHFLRPETEDEALSLVNDTFGSPADVQSPSEHDHGAHGDGHDHGAHGDGHDHGAHGDGHDHGDDDGESGTFHYYIIFLVNQDGVVERSYPSHIVLDMPSMDLIEDVRTVVE
ncbi:SCO family protein [Halobacteria archaeon AArc-dxtr1]|nr:SCO family protein [Halobacteria archaeon AArc-dxtr1]